MSESIARSKEPISPFIKSNIVYIQAQVKDSMDIIIREFRLGNGQPAAVFYIEGLVSKDILGLNLFAPCKKLAKRAILIRSSWRNKYCRGVLQGLTALFIEGSTTALTIEAISWSHRFIVEPPLLM